MLETPTPPPRPSSVGPYRIVEELGVGAMGEVYLAHDPRLDRWVALKRVQPDRLGAESVSRFRREAKAVAQLDHHSIVKIHDWLEAHGSEWLVMERIQGESLTTRLGDEGPMDPLDAVKVAKRIAEGLVVAHAAGIVHRDLKASNIMLTEDGVKILDFGLAKRLPDRSSDETSITSEGQLIGTIASMAPEQAMGLEVDDRADLFALGMLLFEMLSGQAPFRRRSALATLNAICDDPPPPLGSLVAGLPPDLVALVHQLLEKKPQNRPAGGAAEVVERLRMARSSLGGSSAGHLTGPYLAPPGRWRWVSSRRRTWSIAAMAVGLAVGLVAWLWFESRPGVEETFGEGPGQPSGSGSSADSSSEPLRLAVLPFTYQGVEDRRVFADGLTDEIISRLTALDNVAVLPRSSTERYRRQPIDVDAIRRDLSADFILDGHIEWPGDGGPVVLSVWLIRSDDAVEIWRREFRRRPSDLLALQSDVAGDVASQLPISISSLDQRALLLRGTGNQAAYWAYLEGLDWEKRPRFSSSDNSEALEAYLRAIAADPDFVEARAGALRLEALIYLNGTRSPEQAQQIHDHLEDLQRLAPEHPATLLAEADVAYRVDLDWEKSASKLQQILSDQPNNQEVVATMGYVLRRQGHLDEAVERFRAAFAVDALNAELPAAIAETFRAQRRFEQAAKWFRIALRIDASDAWVRGEAALNLFEWRGCPENGPCDADEAIELLAAAPRPGDQAIVLHRFWLDLQLAAPDYDPAALEQALERLGAVGSWDGLYRRLGLAHRVYALRAVGREQEAQELLEDERRQLEDALLLEPDYPAHRGFLAIVLALQKGPEARRRLLELEKSIARTREDLFSGPRYSEYRALSLVLSGQTAEARPLVEQLLETSYQRALTSQTLRLDPLWHGLLAARGKSHAALRAHLFRRIFVGKPRRLPESPAVCRLNSAKNSPLSRSADFHHGLLAGKR